MHGFKSMEEIESTRLDERLDVMRVREREESEVSPRSALGD